MQALVPYSTQALQDQLGFTPPSACSSETSRLMAMRAYQMARQESQDAALFGFAITASLASDQPKKGQHRIHIAAQTQSCTYTWSLVLNKGKRSRSEEEQLSCDLALNALCEIMQLAPIKLLDLGQAETIISHSVLADNALQSLLFSDSSTSQLKHVSDTESPLLVFPGAFNPLHAGHKRMLELACEMTGHPGCYEICVHNIEKPKLDYIALEQRCEPFQDDSLPLVLTTAAKFADKAHCFPGAVFVVGIDTLERIADPRFYENDPGKRDTSIAEIAGWGCRFLVFGRADTIPGNSGFKHMQDLEIPPQLQAICSEVSESIYRMDVSSTALRERSSITNDV